jgi:hypothetical protein
MRVYVKKIMCIWAKKAENIVNFCGNNPGFLNIHIGINEREEYKIDILPLRIVRKVNNKRGKENPSIVRDLSFYPISCHFHLLLLSAVMLTLTFYIFKFTKYYSLSLLILCKFVWKEHNIENTKKKLFALLSELNTFSRNMYILLI